MDIKNTGTPGDDSFHNASYLWNITNCSRLSSSSSLSSSCDADDSFPSESRDEVWCE